MKLIKAIVRPNKVDEVKDALAKLGVAGMTVTEVRGHGKQKGHTAIYRGKEYAVSLLPKMELEIVVPDNIADDVVKAVMGAGRTGLSKSEQIRQGIQWWLDSREWPIRGGRSPSAPDRERVPRLRKRRS